MAARLVVVRIAAMESTRFRAPRPDQAAAPKSPPRTAAAAVK
jgi:hypothetical protein